MRTFKKIAQISTFAGLLFFVWTFGQLSILPGEFVMLRGEEHAFPAFMAPETDGDSFLREKAGANVSLLPTETGSFSLNFRAFGFLSKTATAHVMEPTFVALGGETVGIQMYMDGVLVVGLSEIPGTGRTPGKEAGIMAGDRILSVNGTPLSGSSALETAVVESRGEPLTLSLCRGDKQFSARLSPVYYEDGESYKLGLWVRESAAGIGTLTFSLPENGEYGALGHAIQDPDTGVTVPTAGGNITGCKIGYITKGENGAPGAIHGVFEKEKGTIAQNTELGLYGKLFSSEGGHTIPIAVSTQVKKGEAVICSDAAGNEPVEYTVEIEKILHRKKTGTKNFVVRVTDPELLRLTGGIVQGMSGSPIVQNGKLVGAVTHVFVNDPTRGYGIFIENMLSEVEK